VIEVQETKIKKLENELENEKKNQWDKSDSSNLSPLMKQ
jgi:hypothetical protein